MFTHGDNALMYFGKSSNMTRVALLLLAALASLQQREEAEDDTLSVTHAGGGTCLHFPEAGVCFHASLSPYEMHHFSSVGLTFSGFKHAVGILLIGSFQ